MAAARRERLPAVVEPQDLLLTDIVDAAAPPEWFGFALELAGSGGRVLSALQRASILMATATANVADVRSVASLVAAVFSHDNQDGPFARPFVQAAVKALGSPDRFAHATSWFGRLCDDLNAKPTVKRESRDKLAALVSCIVDAVSPAPARSAPASPMASGAPGPVTGAGSTRLPSSARVLELPQPDDGDSSDGENDAPSYQPLSLAATLQVQKLLNVADPKLLAGVVGMRGRPALLLARRLSGSLIGPGPLAPPSASDVRLSPAASTPAAATWLLTPFGSREAASAYSVISGVDAQSAIAALLQFAEAVDTPSAALPSFDFFAPLASVLAFVFRQRTLTQRSLGRSPDQAVPGDVGLMLARSELAWLYEALERAELAGASWFFSAVHSSTPVLPGLLAIACAALCASSGASPGSAIEEFLHHEGVFVPREQVPLYDAATVTGAQLLCAPPVPGSSSSAASSRATATSSAASSFDPTTTLTGRFRTHFHVTPGALASSMCAALDIPEFRWSDVLGIPLDRGPWAGMSARWPEINAELRRRLPSDIGGVDLKSTVASMVTKCEFRPFRSASLKA
tara:strand:- start:3306 stop:5024 length:1719 start_codon:yes stop_codon:yes gene_type:complete